MAVERPMKLGLSGCGGGLEAVSSDALLDLAVFVEQLGFDGVWLNEEHFQGGRLEVEGRRCLSPLLLASAILARTSRLRVGFSVLLVPLHHPIRLAEEIATLDVLSSGRIDFGISRGANSRYGSVFSTPAGDLDRAFRENLELILRAWAPQPIAIGNGVHSIEPKPVQEPHPPVFIGTHTGSTAAWAAANGHSIICHGITNLPNVRRIVRAFTDAGGDPGPVPIGRFVYVSDSDENARRELWPTILKLTRRLSSLAIGAKSNVLTERDLDPEVFYSEMVIAGGPETCAQRIRALQQELGSDYLNALTAFFGFLPLAELRRSLTLLAGEVRPRLGSTAAHRS
jgi:alkanesulfonate monooxygenase SsuD/methylene tetrahydromethanopterin reductase-like flavin-dependent oxidoreductase (luciferase family)